MAEEVAIRYGAAIQGKVILPAFGIITGHMWEVVEAGGDFRSVEQASIS